jgi:hypothetical protein
MTTNRIRNEATARLADDLIGAAQQLERLARSLKQQATVIRQHGVINDTYQSWAGPIDGPAHIRSHKISDIQNTATHIIGRLAAAQK